MLKAETIANYFLLKLDQDSGDVITNLKMQKLLYYAQGWYLAVTGKKLFGDKIEAWVHGPVVASLYFKYKEHGYNPIPSKGVELKETIKPEIIQLLNQVWNSYGKYTPKYLEELTHRHLPWKQAREGLKKDERSNNEINVEALKNYFVGILNSKCNGKEG